MAATSRSEVFGSIRKNCWSIPMPSNRPALRLQSGILAAARRGRRYRAARAEGDCGCRAQARAGGASLVQAGRLRLRIAGTRLHHAAPGHPEKAARHHRRARASGGHRTSDEDRRLGGRTDAGDGVDRRTPSAAARPDQWLGLQSRDLDGARSAAGAGRRRRTAQDGGGAARGRHRRHPRPGVQPYRRERCRGSDAVDARSR